MASGRATDLTTLEPPDPSAVEDRRHLEQQAVKVPLWWWRERLHPDQVPGVLSPADRYASVMRRDVWAEADDMSTPGSGLRLLWASVAWGAGSRLRNGDRILRAAGGGSALTGPGAAVALTLDAVLRDVARMAVDASTRQQAFELLHHRRGQLITNLGPAFGTKFLYFAGGGRPDHPSVILDRRVAEALVRRGWTSLKTTGAWSSDTYERYCALLQRWVAETGLEGPDRLEKWLFDEARRG